MQHFKKIKVVILLVSLLYLFYSNDITVHASNLDPGAGRLSGEQIDESFYDDSTPNKNVNELSLPWYGSSKTKSPYNNATYTHQDRFDGRTIFHGIDISKWQGPIDWAKVKADGIDYAFIQVGFRGYGDAGILNETTKDPYFDANMQNAIANGIRVGVYVFSQATTEEEAIEEAEYILDSIGGYAISMPLVMDFEYASTDSGLGGRLYKAKLSKEKATSVCMAFCKEVADAGYTPMVYANKSMLADQINASVLTDAGYRIWLANYTKKTTYSGIFDFWQYSEKGKVNGIYGDVDMNFYYAQPTDSFAPVPTTIANSTFSKVEDQIYTGSAITPEVSIMHNGITLIPNVDYTITYHNNTEIGVATIEINGIGAYTHSRRIHFEILPKAVENVKAKKRTKSYITLSWKKDSSMKGYEIYRATAVNGTFTKIKTIKKNSTTTFKNTKLTAGRCYYYKIRSFKKINGETIYSEFSPVTAIYTKTGYTRMALTKYTTPIYDYIPGTKTETITTTEVITQSGITATENETTTDPSTDNGNGETTSDPSTDNGNGDTTSDPSTDNGNGDTTSDPSTDNGNGDTTSDPSTDNGNGDTTSDPSTDNGNGDTTSDPSTDNGNGDTTSDPSTDNGNGETTTDNTPTVTTTVTVTKTVNVDSIPLVSAKKNNAFKVIYSTKYKKQTWYYVSYTVDGVTYKGFVKSPKVTIAKLGKIVKSKKVNVRKKNSASSKRITTIKKNAKVYILSTKKRAGVTWYKVRFKKNNKTYNGWISAPYVKGI